MKPRTLAVIFLSVLLLLQSAGAVFAAVNVASLTRVNETTDGSEANSHSGDAGISEDGRYIVFESYANNLVSGDTNGAADIFLKDQTLSTTTRISVASDGTQGNSSSLNPALSSDGRYVVFESGATNLVSDDLNGKWDIFMKDIQTGTTSRISVASSEAESDGDSQDAKISSDARYVVFESTANNLGAVSDENTFRDVFVRDLTLETTTLISLSTSGITSGNGVSQNPSISADGTFIVYESNSTDLVASDTNGQYDAFLYDQTTGTSELISQAGDGTQGDGGSYDPDVSEDGRYVVFSSTTSTLVDGDTSTDQEVFLKDRNTGGMTRLALAGDGTEGNGISYDPVITDDAAYVAFTSAASNLVSDDTNDTTDVFVYDFLNERLSRVSVTQSGQNGNNSAYGAFIASDGSAVLFLSYATNMITGEEDEEERADVFLAILNLPQADLILYDLAYDLTTEIFAYTIENTGDSRIDEDAIVNTVITIQNEAGEITTVSDSSSVDASGFLSEAGDSTFTYGYRLTDPGVYTVEFCADQDGAVDEADETNNCDSLEVTIEGPDQPDFLVSGFSYDATTETLSYTLMNNDVGEISSKLTSIETSFDITYADGSVRSASENSLEEDPSFTTPGSSATLSYALSLEEGSYTVEVCADSGSTVEESDETNNCLSQTVTVEAAATEEESTSSGETETEEETESETTEEEGTEASEALADAADEDLTCENPFTDTVGHWAEKTVCLLYMEGVVQGISQGIYNPDGEVTRAELLKMILINAGEEVDALLVEPTVTYTDVTEADWFYGYVMHGSNLGVVTGYDDGTFLPNEPVNRAEALVMLLRMAGVEDTNTAVDFSDMTGEEWFANEVGMGVDLGIIEGYEEDNTFRPANSITRAEAAKIIRRAWYAWYGDS